MIARRARDCTYFPACMTCHFLQSSCQISWQPSLVDSGHLTSQEPAALSCLMVQNLLNGSEWCAWQTGGEQLTVCPCEPHNCHCTDTAQLGDRVCSKHRIAACAVLCAASVNCVLCRRSMYCAVVVPVYYATSALDSTIDVPGMNHTQCSGCFALCLPGCGERGLMQSHTMDRRNFLLIQGLGASAERAVVCLLVGVTGVLSRPPNAVRSLDWQAI